MKMLAIGSVFKYEGIKLMVVGHDVDKKTNEYSYIALPYPVGFAGKDKMYSVKVNKEVEVLYEGYLTARGEKYMGQLDKISDLTPAQVVVYNTIATEALKRANGGQQ